MELDQCSEFNASWTLGSSKITKEGWVEKVRSIIGARKRNMAVNVKHIKAWCVVERMKMSSLLQFLLVILTLMAMTIGKGFLTAAMAASSTSSNSFHNVRIIGFMQEKYSVKICSYDFIIFFKVYKSDNFKSKLFTLNSLQENRPFVITKSHH